MQGFFHGTGHGLGLDIHEPPRIAPLKQPTNAVTVEPGHLGVGGRLEDVIVVGNRNLTDCPQFRNLAPDRSEENHDRASIQVSSEEQGTETDSNDYYGAWPCARISQVSALELGLQAISRQRPIAFDPD